jgi:tellurite methyltransferase
MSGVEKWNDRYARGEGHHDFTPASPLPLAVEAAPPGLALDLACGAGRHAIYLAEHGWRVVAVDWSAPGLDLMMREAAARGVADRIEPVVADLESTPRGFEIAPGRYDLVCDFFFLDRQLFDEIREGVRPGGLFAAAIHVSAGHSYTVAPGEMERLVSGWGWEVLHSRDEPTSEVLARRPTN